jgi:hypothetical protein
MKPQEALKRIRRVSLSSEANGSSNSRLLEYIKSLSFPELESHCHNIDAAFGDTCTWLFEHPLYQAWEKENESRKHGSSVGQLLLDYYPGGPRLEYPGNRRILQSNRVLLGE